MNGWEMVGRIAVFMAGAALFIGSYWIGHRGSEAATNVRLVAGGVGGVLLIWAWL